MINKLKKITFVFVIYFVCLIGVNAKELPDYRYVMAGACINCPNNISVECGDRVYVVSCDDGNTCKVNLNGNIYNFYHDKFASSLEGVHCSGSVTSYKWPTTGYTNSSNSTSEKTNTTSTNNNSSNKYKVLFDENYGYGLECNNGTSYYSDGKCYAFKNKGTKQNFPVTPNDNKMSRGGQEDNSGNYKYDFGYLIGWTKKVYNGRPLCDNKNITRKNKTYSIENDETYYACYNEHIGGNRLIDAGAEVNKPDNVAAIPCGQEFWIDYCNRDSSGKEYCYGILGGVVRKLDRDKISDDASGLSCSQDSSVMDEWQYATETNGDIKCGNALHITSCNDETCTYDKYSDFDGNTINVSGGQIINKNSLDKSSDNAAKICKEKDNNIEKGKCVNNSTSPMRRSSDTYSICYDENADVSEIKKNLEKYYVCDTESGYYLDKTKLSAVNNTKECDNGVCNETWNVSCTKGESSKPTLSVTSGFVQGNTGIITVKAEAKEGKITGYYYSDTYLAPTNSTEGWNELTNTNSFTIESTPGIQYIWVRDSKGNISNAVSGAVIDNTNSDTTISKLELYDENGHVNTPTGSGVGYQNTINSSQYVLMSNELTKDSKALADAFNPYVMEYKLEVDSPTVTVYATLTSTDSKYIQGYEPRTVNLKYGVNTILIKIQNNEGKVRTYTILVTRIDDRTSDNTLNDLKISEGNISFNSNVTDYKVEIKKSISSVKVDSTLSSDKASYIDGYEPGDVKIEGDTTVKLIKVKSETGSTRTYVITFVKEGTDIITDKSLQLRDLVIPGVYIPFESNVANYSFSVGYSSDSIDLNINLNDENTTSIIRVKRKDENDYQIVSGTGIKLDVGENFIEIILTNSEGNTSYYRLTVIRKEFGLDISNDTSLKDLKVLGYNIKFSPNKKDYTVRIKQEKSLVITAVPTSNRAEVFIRGNEELTGFSTVRVKVVAENGKFETYSIDIKKDAFNKAIEIASIVIGAVIILVSGCIIVIKKKSKARKEYFEE